MEWITWGDTLQLGNERIDNDHQKLAAIINKMADGVINHSALNAHQQLFRELMEKTMAHFAEEEQLMAAHRYPHAAEHRAEHNNLVQTAKGFMTELDANASPSVALLHFLRRWLTRHVVAMDQALVDYLESSR